MHVCPQKVDVDRSSAMLQRYVLLGALPVDFRVLSSALVFVLLGARCFFKHLIRIYKFTNFRCVTRARVLTHIFLTESYTRARH